MCWAMQEYMLHHVKDEISGEKASFSWTLLFFPKILHYFFNKNHQILYEDYVSTSYNFLSYGNLGSRCRLHLPNALWTIPIGEKVIVKFNGMLQPICMSGLKFCRLGATYVRSGKFVGLSAPDWRTVNPQAKEGLWTALIVSKTS